MLKIMIDGSARLLFITSQFTMLFLRDQVPSIDMRHMQKITNNITSVQDSVTYDEIPPLFQ